MKKVLSFVAICSSLLLIQQKMQAQSHPVVYIKSIPEWVPAKGFWVVESHGSRAKQHTVYFYNDARILVYTEKLEGVRLNIKKQKVKMRLKKALETALLAWEQNEQPLQNQYLVLNQLQQH